MVFSSITFLGVFLPVFLIAYFLLKKRGHRNILIILFSLLFYTWGEPIWIIGILILTFADYALALFSVKVRSSQIQKWYLGFVILLNLSLLLLLKYYGFFAENWNHFLNGSLPQTSFHMPIGISFFTFQALTYVVDVCNKKVEPQKNFGCVLLYISMFPQLIAGPIIRYADVAAQIEKRTETLEGFQSGMLRFTIGLAKKVILANYAGSLADTFLNESHIPTLTTAGAWFGILMFTFQIYFDFSGYSDMAIGLGKIMGFQYKENFNYPYIARNVSDFWKRWHISLSSFFRDYVYIPLGGNRKHMLRNLTIVWLLTGLWHGANWNFVLWGLYYLFLLMIEKLLEKMQIDIGRIPLVGNLLLLFFVLVGWSFFYFENLSTLAQFFKIFFGLTNSVEMTLREATPVYQYYYLILMMLPACTPLPKKIATYFFPQGKTRTEFARCILICGLLSLCFLLLLKQSYNPFLYFRF